MPKPISPLIAGVVYAICGIIWVLSTDVLLNQFFRSAAFDTFSFIQLFKDTWLILLTGILLYLVLKKNQDQLRSYGKAYIRLFRENPQPMWIFRRDDLRFLEVNDAATQLYGYTREEFLEMTIIDIRPAEDADKLHASHQRSMATDKGLNIAGEWRHCKKDGSLMYVRIESFRTMYANESVEVVSIFDVTDKYLADEALDRQEQLLKTIINSTQSMVWAVSPQLQFLAMNNTFRERSDCLPGIDQPDDRWKACYEKSLQGEKQLIEFTGEKEGADWKYVQISFDPIFHNGKITGVACIAWDITEKKQQELALKKAVERYELLAQATNDIIFDLDLATNKVLFNYNGQDIFGSSYMEDGLARWSARIHPEDVDDIMSSFEHAVREKLHHWQGEYRLRNYKGEYRHVISRGYILYNDEMEPVRMIGALQDIQDRKVKDEEIRKLSLVASMTHTPIIVTDAKGNIEWVNKSFEDLTGYVLEDVRGLPPQSFLHGEGTDPAALDEIRQKLAASQSCVVEVLNYTSTGEPYWVIMDITPVTNTAGELERLIIIQTNVTEKKKIAQQLEEKNKLILDVAFIGSHRLRASVASLLGILLQLDKEDLSRPENVTLLQYIDKLVKDMDLTLHEMADKCNRIYEAEHPSES